MFKENKANQIFRKTNSAYQGVRNVRPSEHLVCFAFFKHLFRDSPPPPRYRRTMNSPEIIIIRTVPRRCSVKIVFLKISQNWQENNCARVSFLIKLQDIFHKTHCVKSVRIQSLSGPYFPAFGLNTETLAQVFFCELCII